MELITLNPDARAMAIMLEQRPVRATLTLNFNTDDELMFNWSYPDETQPAGRQQFNWHLPYGSGDTDKWLTYLAERLREIELTPFENDSSKESIAHDAANQLEQFIQDLPRLLFSDGWDGLTAYESNLYSPFKQIQLTISAEVPRVFAQERLECMKRFPAGVMTAEFTDNSGNESSVNFDVSHCPVGDFDRWFKMTSAAATLLLTNVSHEGLEFDRPNPTLRIPGMGVIRFTYKWEHLHDCRAAFLNKAGVAMTGEQLGAAMFYAADYAKHDLCGPFEQPYSVKRNPTDVKDVVFLKYQELDFVRID